MVLPTGSQCTNYYLCKPFVRFLLRWEDLLTLGSLGSLGLSHSSDEWVEEAYANGMVSFIFLAPESQRSQEEPRSLSLMVTIVPSASTMSLICGVTWSCLLAC
jgi:hypothetical protein